tara:strand:- start:268 stop:729 length:462 start_codon:yes stop_codon:yes gene_type:complete
MNLSQHIKLTIPLAVICYLITGSWKSFLGLFIGGILIDVDHLLEFWHDHGFNLRIRDFFQAADKGRQTRHYIVFHSYELALALMVAAYFGIYPSFFWAIATGILFHILLDYVNIIGRLRYKWYSFILFFFVFRAVFLFQRDKIDKVIRHSVET